MTAAATKTTPAISMPASPHSFIDAAADAVARAIADVRREAARERELREAEHRARLAEVETRLQSVAELERQVRERLASLKDGEAGAQGDVGPEGQPGEPGPVGERGAAGDRGEQGERGFDLDDFDTEVVDDGRTLVLAFTRGDLTEKHEIPLPVGPQGEVGTAGAPGERGEAGPAGERGLDGEPGTPGERGPEGAPGKLPIAKIWNDDVHYEGDVVTHDGGTYQAQKDTARTPPHEDWRCLAQAGRNGADGRSFAVRGTWQEDAAYQAMDVVALGGASFVAKQDEPGPCPGEGWQLMSAQGKRGNAGERGMPGPKGDPGPSAVSFEADGDGVLTITNADGSRVTCDLYPLLSRLVR